MKLLHLLILISLVLPSPTILARTVEIKVHGMTCAFCVDGLKRKFKQMPAVSKVQVSLKLKKIRLETQAQKPTLKGLKQAVLDAGFTPTKITILPDEKK